MKLSRLRTAGVVLATVTGLAAASYAAIVAASWLRYGHVAEASHDDADTFLDRFMPEYEVAERHHVRVAAPADVTFEALMDMELEDSSVIRAIFKGRELLLGADADAKPRARGLVALTKELGWARARRNARPRDCDGSGHAAMESRCPRPRLAAR